MVLEGAGPLPVNDTTSQKAVITVEQVWTSFTRAPRPANAESPATVLTSISRPADDSGDDEREPVEEEREAGQGEEGIGECGAVRARGDDDGGDGGGRLGRGWCGSGEEEGDGGEEDDGGRCYVEHEERQGRWGDG